MESMFFEFSGLRWNVIRLSGPVASQLVSVRFGVEAKARRMSEAHKAVIIIEDAVRGG